MAARGYKDITKRGKQFTTALQFSPGERAHLKPLRSRGNGDHYITMIRTGIGGISRQDHGEVRGHIDNAHTSIGSSIIDR